MQHNSQSHITSGKTNNKLFKWSLSGVSQSSIILLGTECAQLKTVKLLHSQPSCLMFSSEFLLPPTVASSARAAATPPSPLKELLPSDGLLYCLMSTCQLVSSNRRETAKQVKPCERVIIMPQKSQPYIDSIIIKYMKIPKNPVSQKIFCAKKQLIQTRPDGNVSTTVRTVRWGAPLHQSCRRPHHHHHHHDTPRV